MKLFSANLSQSVPNTHMYSSVASGQINCKSAFQASSHYLRFITGVKESIYCCYPVNLDK